MSHRTLCIFATVNILLLFNHSSATTGGYAGTFLQVGVGSRPLGMGGAFVAVANDVNAAYWNPAGLAQLSSKQFTGTHAFMTLNRGYDFISFAQPTSSIGTFSLSWLSFGVDKIQGRDEFGNTSKDLSNTESAVLLSYGREILQEVAAGASLKLIYQSIANREAWGVGIDLGVLLDIAKLTGVHQTLERLSLGVVMQDLGSSLKWNTESRCKDDIPHNIKLGVSVKPIVVPTTIAIDLSNNTKQGTQYHVGIEYEAQQPITIRVGYDHGEVTFGAGLKMDAISWVTESSILNIDYQVSIGNELGIIQRISLTFSP